MKRTVLLSLCLLFVFSMFGCGSSDTAQDVSADAVTEEAVEPEQEEPATNYDEFQVQMSNYMNQGYAYVANGWVYTIGWNPDNGAPRFIKMRTDSSDYTVIADGVPFYITVKGEYIYVSLLQDDIQSLFRFRLGGDDAKKLVENVNFVSIVDDTIYYTKEKDGVTQGFYKCDLEGANEEAVLEKCVYYPYVAGDYLYYQDDADKETIHRYSFETGEDIRITDTHTYSYVLNNDYMYCLLNDKSVLDGDTTGTVAKVDLKTLETQTLYDGADTMGIAVNEDRVFFINTNDENRLYSIDKNGENISIVAQDDNCWPPCICGDSLVYEDSAANYEYIDNLFICNLDGSGKALLENDN